MEEMSQRRAANIRPIEPAVPPLSPTNLTIPLLGAGLFVGIIFSIVVALISEARRPGIISPEKLERTLGLTVLVSVPEAPFIAEAGI
jgi:capsular polysaccharide biosynthesis protein